MTFDEILKSSFLTEISTQNISVRQTAMSLILTAIIGIYIFYCYKYLTRKTFYSKNFNMSLIAIAIITCGIILAIQSSVVISLGMVGALSIVRFRTAIKDPMDLAFLFWAISTGIICGAHLTTLAVMLSLLLTVLIMFFDRLPTSKAAQILVINGVASEETSEEIETLLNSYSKSFTEKSRSISGGNIDLVYEVRIEKGIELSQKLSELDNIYGVSLLQHDGEVTF